MTARTWLYEQLTQDTEMIALVEDRVFAKKSMTSAVENHPYIVYKFGFSADEGLAETEDINRQFIQIFIHDFSDGEVADYMRIDQVIRQVRKTLRHASSASEGVVIARYLETSQDLSDETLNTVMKYIRFQLITKEI